MHGFSTKKSFDGFFCFSWWWKCADQINHLCKLLLITKTWRADIIARSRNMELLARINRSNRINRNVSIALFIAVADTLEVNLRLFHGQWAVTILSFNCKKWCYFEINTSGQIWPCGSFRCVLFVVVLVLKDNQPEIILYFDDKH